MARFWYNSLQTMDFQLSPWLIKLRIASSHYRALVVYRFIAAIVGGYLLTALSTAVLGVALPLQPSDAVLLAVSLSILIYACIFIYTFSVRSVAKVWITILLTSAALTALLAFMEEWL
ncbi:hypothetical protein FIU82_17620 (plasmid) [Pseudoalteromonas sp. THAF3]|nr:hypothetical protein FIU82_17620 [Pseudoalteromonas sp. THAF3]